ALGQNPLSPEPASSDPSSWFAPLLVLFVVNMTNWTLIATRGQSVGKIAVGTRIVSFDGGRGPFVAGVVVRSLLPFALARLPPGLLWLGLAPLVLNIVSTAILMVIILDVVWILDKDRRCLHDILADTKVVLARR